VGLLHSFIDDVTTGRERERERERDRGLAFRVERRERGKMLSMNI
jgi:hypothetical protein